MSRNPRLTRRLKKLDWRRRGRMREVMRLRSRPYTTRLLGYLTKKLFAHRQKAFALAGIQYTWEPGKATLKIGIPSDFQIVQTTPRERK